jgi:hypothetical protein
LPYVGRARARSAQIGGPDTISQCFQVSAYSSEPFTAILARNLLSKDDWRAALRDEAGELWPQVALVGCAFALSRSAEGLAGARAGPDWPLIRPPGQLQGLRPAANTRKEMTLCISLQVVRLNVYDAAAVNVARRDAAERDQVFQPVSSIRIELVVVIHSILR